jgi:hypothetical protein
MDAGKFLTRIGVSSGQSTSDGCLIINSFSLTEREVPGMRKPKALRLDLSVLDQARERAGLPQGTPDGAVVRYALAVVAGIDPTDQLDSTGGRGSVSHRESQASRDRVSAIAAQYGVQAA